MDLFLLAAKFYFLSPGCQKIFARSEASSHHFGEVRVQDIREVRVQDRDLADEDLMLCAYQRPESAAEEAGPGRVNNGVAWARAQVRQYKEWELKRKAILVRITVR